MFGVRSGATVPPYASIAPIARAGPVWAYGDECVFGGVRNNGLDVDVCDDDGDSGDDDGGNGEARLGDGGARGCCWDLEKRMSCSAYRCISSGDMTRRKSLRRRNWSSSWLSSACGRPPT